MENANRHEQQGGVNQKYCGFVVLHTGRDGTLSTKVEIYSSIGAKKFFSALGIPPPDNSTVTQSDATDETEVRSCVIMRTVDVAMILSSYHASYVTDDALSSRRQ